MKQWFTRWQSSFALSYFTSSGSLNKPKLIHLNTYRQQKDIIMGWIYGINPGKCPQKH